MSITLAICHWGFGGPDPFSAVGPQIFLRAPDTNPRKNCQPPSRLQALFKTVVLWRHGCLSTLGCTEPLVCPLTMANHFHDLEPIYFSDTTILEVVAHQRIVAQKLSKVPLIVGWPSNHCVNTLAHGTLIGDFILARLQEFHTRRNMNLSYVASRSGPIFVGYFLVVNHMSNPNFFYVVSKIYHETHHKHRYKFASWYPLSMIGLFKLNHDKKCQCQSFPCGSGHG